MLVPSLANQRLAKIVGTVFKAIYYDRAPKRIKTLLDFRSEWNPDIQKLPKINNTNYGLETWRYLAPKL